MGILADLPNSAPPSFQNPKNSVPMGPISNMFICPMHAFQFEFAVKFDPNPNNGVGGSPSESESWTIGIVQNVIFEILNFKYDDGSVFNVTFNDSALDCVDNTIRKPFFSDPVFLEMCKVDPTLPCGRWIGAQVSVADIFYTSKGYGELLDPYDASGVHTSNKPDSFNIADEPNFGARLRLANGALISRAEHVLAFQTWLVAKTPKDTHLLANIPAFSLVFWMQTKPSPGLLSIGTPPYDFAFYAENGIARTVKVGGTNIQLRAGLGRGGRSPIMSGPTANERGRRWLNDNKLIP